MDILHTIINYRIGKLEETISNAQDDINDLSSITNKIHQVESDNLPLSDNEKLQMYHNMLQEQILYITKLDTKNKFLWDAYNQLNEKRAIISHQLINSNIEEILTGQI